MEGRSENLLTLNWLEGLGKLEMALSSSEVDIGSSIPTVISMAPDVRNCLCVGECQSWVVSWHLCVQV